MPEPTTTANRSRLSSVDRQARVLHREVGRRHRVVDEGVHLLDLLLRSMYSDGSKPFTSPAMREVKREASKRVIGPMPAASGE